MKTSDKIRKHIRECGKSQRQIAANSNVSQQQISRFMQGYDINLSTAERLCLGLGIAGLLGWTQSIRPTRTWDYKKRAGK